MGKQQDEQLNCHVAGMVYKNVTCIVERASLIVWWFEQKARFEVIRNGLIAYSRNVD